QGRHALRTATRTPRQPGAHMADQHGGRIDRRGFLGAVLVTAAGGPTAPARQPARPNERLVEPVSLPLDKANVWTLYFRYKAPRIVPVDALDRNNKPTKKHCWYMWFQVYSSEEDTSELQSRGQLVCRLLLVSKKPIPPDPL